MRKVRGSISCAAWLGLARAGIVLLAAPALLAQESPAALPQHPVAVVKQAIQLNSLTGPDMKPWRLKAAFHTFTPASDFLPEENKQGKYEELWVADNKFKQSYSDEEYSQTIYGTSDGKFIAGGLHFILGNLGQLHEFFQPAAYLRQYAEEHDPKLDLANVRAGEPTCIRSDSARTKDPNREPLVYRFCFGPSLRLVRFSINGDDDFLVLFRNYRSFRGLAVPGEVELRRHGIVRVVATLETLERADPVDEAELQPPPAAVQDESEPPHVSTPSASMCPCIERSAAPIYPPIAKAAGISGTVVLMGTVGTDGKVYHLAVVSGPPELQRAAVDAVKSWHYKPYLQNGAPVAVKTTINVVFTLGK